MLNYVAPPAPTSSTARRTGATRRRSGARVPAGKADARGSTGRPSARRWSSRWASCSGSWPRSRSGCSTRGCVRFEVGVIADSPRAARYAGMRTRRKILAVMAISGAIAGIGGASQIGDFTHARRQPDRSPGCGLRLHGHRRGGARALQPVRRLSRGGAHRRAAERRLHAAGTGLPVRVVGVMQGIIPVPWAASCSCATGCGSRSGREAGYGGRRAVSQRQPARDRARAGDSLRHAALYAALGEPLAERSGVLNLGVQGMMLFGAAVGFWTTQRFDGAGGRRCPGRHRLGSGGGGAGRDPRVPRDHASREPDRLGARAHDLRRRTRPVRVPRDGARSRRPSRDPPVRRARRARLETSLVGPILFDQSALVYASWILTLLVALYLGRTRSASTSAPSARRRRRRTRWASTTLYRYVHVMVGGGFAGIAGACYSLSITPGWTAGDTLVGGAGWIAIALVIFAFWRAELVSSGRSVRSAVGAPVRAPGTRGGRHAGVPLRTPVRHDDRRAGARLDRPRPTQARRAGGPQSRTCAKNGRRDAWTSSPSLARRSAAAQGRAPDAVPIQEPM